MIYFDNSATTPLHPEVRDAMLPYLNELFGNPSSKYYKLAERVKKDIETARENVARLLGCEPEEVVFTSGATESNNMILKGLADQYPAKGKHIVTTKAEHPSILETARYLESKGYQVTYLDVDQFARADVNRFKELLATSDSKPMLVSIMWGNNEVGTLNNIEAFATFCRENDIFFHTDATQVTGKIPIDISQQGIQFLSCSAHKIYGPKGIGACIIRKHRLGFKTKLTPLFHGGEQENGYRSGTLSTHNIIGFGKAAEIALRDLNETQQTLTELEEYLINQVAAHFGDTIHLNSDRANKIPGVISLNIKGINNELFIRKIADQVAVSTGSACSSSKPSHVLQSMGLTLDEIRSTVRISLSRFNTKDEIDQFIQSVKK